MAIYWRIRNLTEKHRIHVAERLLDLRNALREQIASKENVGELKVATWNLMHFGGSGGYHRSTESLQYIAEIIDQFDVVSIQEVKRDLKQLKSLLKDYLGGDWDYVVSDTTEGDPGNDERMAFLYRKERVRFSRVAGEIVLPALKTDAGIVNPRQLARSPFYLGFQAGWFKFNICAVHIHYGAKGGEDREIRVKEIEDLAKQLKKRGDAERGREIKFAEKQDPPWDTTPSAANYLVLGDFNIHKNSPSKGALTNNGFDIPDDIDDLPTNTGKSREPFDQIAVRINDARFKQGAGGVFDFRDYVYRTGDSEFYRKIRTKSRKWPSGMDKLEDRMEALKTRPQTKKEEAEKKREKAAEEQNSANAAKLKEAADKLEADAKELEGIYSDQSEREKYFASEFKDYFSRYFRKNQISDHLLLWTSFKIDYADNYLQELAEPDPE